MRDRLGFSWSTAKPRTSLRMRLTECFGISERDVSLTTGKATDHARMAV
jgi:hypothetical protein